MSGCKKYSFHHVGMFALAICTSHVIPATAQTNQLPGILIEGAAPTAGAPARVAQTTTQDFQSLEGRPSSVSSFSAEDIEARRVNSTRDIGNLTPNVSGFDGGGNRMTAFTIRGVREFGYQSSPGVVPSIGYYVDDVPALTTLARASVFRNIDSLTLLRGPQGAGFGFSRPGGVINIQTGSPSDKTQAYGIAGFGNYKQREVAVGFSSPTMINGLSVSGDFVYESRDGFYDNTALNETYGDKSAYGGRIKVRYALGSRTTIDLMLRHERMDDQSDPFVSLSDLLSNPFEVAYNDPGFEKIGQDVQALRIKSSFSKFDFMSVTSHSRSKWEFRSDGDLTATPTNPMNPFARLIGVTDEEIRSVTQEFRFKSNNLLSPFQWSGGLFFARTSMDFSAGFTAFPNTVINGFPLRSSQSESHDATVWGEVDYRISQSLRVVPGIRFEWAKRDVENGNPAPNIQAAEDTFTAILPSLAVKFDPNKQTSLYARYTRGFKPGGFVADRSLTDIDEFQFESESSNNFEVGFKAKLIPGTLVVNGSLFYSDFEDYQVYNQFSPVEFGVNNAQDVTSFGGELELALRFAEGWRAYSGIGVTRAKYNTFVNAFGDFSDNEVPYIPAFTANYGLAYQARWGGYVQVDARTFGRYFLDDQNTSRQDAFTLVDARIGYKTESLDVSFFAKNIFDQRYIINLYDFAGTGGGFGNVGDPATYGVRAKLKY